MRGLWAVREWQVFICIVGRSGVPGCVFLNSNSSRQLVYYVVVKCLSLAVSRASFSLCFIDVCLKLLILQCVLFGLIQLISSKIGVSPNIHYKNGCLGHWAYIQLHIYIYMYNIFIILWSYSYTVYITPLLLLEMLWWEDGPTGQKHDFKSWWFHTCCHWDVQLGSP